MDLDNLLFESADMDVTITKDVSAKENVMQRLARYEELEALKSASLKRSEEARAVITKIQNELLETNAEYKAAIEEDNASDIALADIANEQDRLKEEILAYQREAFGDNVDNKSLTYNNVTSTYVAPTEKNSFDLKKFREEQVEFWDNHQTELAPYAKITPVSDYIKVTVK